MEEIAFSITNINELREEYYQTEDILLQAEIVKKCRLDYEMKYKDIAIALYETERRLYRLLDLDKLIPELKEMLTNGDLTQRKALALAPLEVKVQRDIYTQFREQFRRTKQAEFMQLVKTKWLNGREVEEMKIAEEKRCQLRN